MINLAAMGYLSKPLGFSSIAVRIVSAWPMNDLKKDIKFNVFTITFVSDYSVCFDNSFRKRKIQIQDIKFYDRLFNYRILHSVDFW